MGKLNYPTSRYHVTFTIKEKAMCNKTIAKTFKFVEGVCIHEKRRYTHDLEYHINFSKLHKLENNDYQIECKGSETYFHDCPDLDQEPNYAADYMGIFQKLLGDYYFDNFVDAIRLFNKRNSQNAIFIEIWELGTFFGITKITGYLSFTEKEHKYRNFHNKPILSKFNSKLENQKVTEFKDEAIQIKQGFKQGYLLDSFQNADAFLNSINNELFKKASFTINSSDLDLNRHDIVDLLVDRSLEYLKQSLTIEQLRSIVKIAFIKYLSESKKYLGGIFKADFSKHSNELDVIAMLMCSSGYFNGYLKDDKKATKPLPEKKIANQTSLFNLA